MLADTFRMLPEVVLGVFAILVMVMEPVFPAGRKGVLAWVAVLGVLLAGAALPISARSPGLAFHSSVAADSFTFYFTAVLLLVALLTLLGSMNYLDRDHIHHGEFYALVLTGTLGACFMVAATELIMAFIGLEISSISTYVLAGFRRQDKQSNEASVKYFMLGSFATAFFLYGIAFVYGITGTTNLMMLGRLMTERSEWPPIVWVALIMIFVGLAFKVSTVPFQIWTPDVYQGAPAPVSGFLSVGPKAAAFAVLLRILLGAFLSGGAVTFWIIWTSAILTMSVGNLAALLQTNIKRLLAYSAIAHAGYVLVGIAAVLAPAVPTQSEGTSSVLFYLLVYALMNLGAFVLIGHLGGSGERWANIDDYVGFAYERPGAAACLAVFLLSLAGFPTTAGFFAKFYVFRSAIHSHLIALTVVALLNSVVSVYYYLRLVVVMYMREGTPAASTARIPWPLGAAIAVSITGIFYLGLFPNLLVSLANRAAVPLP